MGELMRIKKLLTWSSIIILLIIILILSAIISLTIGSASIPPDIVYKIIISQLFNLNESFPKNWDMIVWNMRLPRILLTILIGMALAIAGATMQGLFRNPLADPFIIGISAGGAFGAIIGEIIRHNLFMAIPKQYLMPLFSFLGAMGTIILVYLISKKGRKVSITTMLLVGIALSSFFSAITLFLIYIQAGDPRTVIFWMMGELNTVKWFEVNVSAPLIFFGLGILIFYSRDLNAFSLGEDTAKQLGVNVERVKLILLCAAALVTAISVAFAGIIGFVGLIIPHIMRKIVGPDHRILLPASALFGAIFLVWANVISINFSQFVNLFTDQQIGLTILPVGVVTALFGAPFFLYLLVSRK
jgi:iron complex transport system permease protein